MQCSDAMTFSPPSEQLFTRPHMVGLHGLTLANGWRWQKCRAIRSLVQNCNDTAERLDDKKPGY